MAEVWGLFVDDGALAIVTVTAILAVALFANAIKGQREIAGWLLVGGILVAIMMGLAGPARNRARAVASDQPAEIQQS